MDKLLELKILRVAYSKVIAEPLQLILSAERDTRTCSATIWKEA